MEAMGRALDAVSGRDVRGSGVRPLRLSAEGSPTLRTAVGAPLAEQPEAVERDGDGGAHVREHGEPQCHEPEGREQNEEALEEYGDHDVLLDDPLGVTRELDGLGQLRQIVLHERHIGGL
jgi:hypothetical protein